MTAFVSAAVRGAAAGAAGISDVVPHLGFGVVTAAVARGLVRAG